MKTYAITVAWSNSRKSELGLQLVCVKADNLGDARCQALDTVAAECKTLGVQRTFWIGSWPKTKSARPRGIDVRCVAITDEECAETEQDGVR